MKDFMLERDFALDLLLFIAASTAWSPRNSRVNRLEPEYLGKPSFYLDALDRDVRKAHEQASIGVLLCASKEDKVAEYALSRTRSPALIAQDQTMLPDKKLLQGKLNELYNHNASEEDE